MKRIASITAGAAAALALAAGPALAAPGGNGNGNAPADGQCVAAGVQTLGGKGLGIIGAVASSNDPAPVRVIIQDHVFNNADVVEGILGITICE